MNLDTIQTRAENESSFPLNLDSRHTALVDRSVRLLRREKGREREREREIFSRNFRECRAKIGNYQFACNDEVAIRAWALTYSFLEIETMMQVPVSASWRLFPFLSLPPVVVISCCLEGSQKSSWKCTRKFLFTPPPLQKRN